MYRRYGGPRGTRRMRSPYNCRTMAKMTGMPGVARVQSAQMNVQSKLLRMQGEMQRLQMSIAMVDSNICKIQSMGMMGDNRALMRCYRQREQLMMRINVLAQKMQCGCY